MKSLPVKRQHTDALRMGQADDEQAFRIAGVGAQGRHVERQLVDLDRIDSFLLGVDDDDTGTIFGQFPGDSGTGIVVAADQIERGRGFAAPPARSGCC